MKKTTITAKTLIARAEDYFSNCHSVLDEKANEKRRPPTIEGLASHIGISKRTLLSYMNGGFQAKGSAQTVADYLERARDRIVAEMLEASLLGKYDARICMLVLESLGYKEGNATDNAIIVEWRGGEHLESWAQ